MVELHDKIKKSKYKRIVKSAYSAFLVPFIGGMMLTAGIQITSEFNRYAGIALMIISAIIFYCGIKESANDSIKLEERIDRLEEQIKELKKEK